MIDNMPSQSFHNPSDSHKVVAVQKRSEQRGHLWPKQRPYVMLLMRFRQRTAVACMADAFDAQERCCLVIIQGDGCKVEG